MESEIIIAGISVLGSALAAIPAVVKYRTKLSDIRGLFVALDDALEDGEITPAEAKRILRHGKRIFNL